MTTETVTIQITNSARKEAGKDPVNIEFEMPTTMAEAVEAWGEEIVFQKACQQVVVDFQGAGRRLMTPDDEDKIKTDKEIVASMKEWTPKLRAKAKSKIEKATAIFGDLSDDEKKALLDKLKG